MVELSLVILFTCAEENAAKVDKPTFKIRVNLPLPVICPTFQEYFKDVPVVFRGTQLKL